MSVENPMVINNLWTWKERTLNDDYCADLFDEELDQVECEVCKDKIHKIDEATESEMWADVYICDKTSCIHTHYKGWQENIKKRPFGRMNTFSTQN